MSSDSLSNEDFKILQYIADLCRKSGLGSPFTVNPSKLIVDAPPDLQLSLTVEEFIERLDSLVKRNLLKAVFDKKILMCSRCNERALLVRTKCRSCQSEDIEKSLIYIHSCGVSIPEQALKNLTSCPKCKEAVEKQSFTAIDFRFICNGCGSVFEEPAVDVECPACGLVDGIKNIKQLTLRKYSISQEGRELLESADPVKQLIRKLISQGFLVVEKVPVVGLSGTVHVLDVIATNHDMSETRIYMVLPEVRPNDIVSWLVKRLDVEKTALLRVVGKVRWIIAGNKIQEGVDKAGQSLGLEVEQI